VAVGAGVLATCVAFWLLFIVVGLPLFTNLYPEGVVLPTGLAWYVHVVSATLPPLASWLAAFAVGGLVVGVAAHAFSGLNGALSAAVTALGGFAWWVWGLIPWVFLTPSNPGQAYTRAENVGDLIFFIVVFCVLFPFVVLAGCIGGRLGGRLRSRINQRRALT
jgi:hypothetical protein